MKRNTIYMILMIFFSIILSGTLFCIYLICKPAFEMLGVSNPYMDVWATIGVAVIEIVFVSAVLRIKKLNISYSKRFAFSPTIIGYLITINLFEYFKLLDISIDIWMRVLLIFLIGCLFILYYFDFEELIQTSTIKRFGKCDEIQEVLKTYRNECVWVTKEQYTKAIEEFVLAGIFKKQTMKGLEDFSNNAQIKLYLSEKKYLEIVTDTSDSFEPQP